MVRKISESDTRANYIDPQLRSRGWMPENIIREYYFTDGRKLVGDTRGERLFVDYLLKYNNTNVAIIEAKKADEEPTKGLQQAIKYAQKLRIDIVYSTNGKQIYEFDLRTGKGDYVDGYPTSEELYQNLNAESFKLKEKLHNVPFLLTGAMQPRYYQEIAVNKTLDSIAEGKKRVLLTLATGTGKTFVSFQIVPKPS